MSVPVLAHSFLSIQDTSLRTPCADLFKGEAWIEISHRALTLAELTLSASSQGICFPALCQSVPQS